MNDFMYDDEYLKMESELKNFYKIYEILKVNAIETINNLNEDSEISYFCIVSNEDSTYIIFYSDDGEDLLQVLTHQENRKIFLLLADLIEEKNVDKPSNDGYTYRAFCFKYQEEPYFIKQIMLGTAFENTELIKEIKQEKEYYADKTVEKNKYIFDYTKTDALLNKYKFAEE